MNLLDRVVRVVFKGEESVSAAADKARSGVDGFAGKVPGWVSVVGGITAAYYAVSGAIRAVAEVIADSFRAYDDLERSQRKLEGTSKLTGIALEDLNVIAAVGRTAFGLSTVVARDFATEVAKLGEKAGDTTKAKDALQAFLEIGASRGLTASETLKAVQQSLLGIDEGTDKLFGKNPSGLWADYEKVIGKAAGKFSDADKAAALLHAALDAAPKVLGAYSSFLESTAGQTDQLAQKSEEAKARIGESLDGMRGAYLDVASSVKPGFFDLMRREIDNLNNSIEGWKAVTYGALALVKKWLGDDKSYVEYGIKAANAAKAADEWAKKSTQSAKDLADATKGYGGSLRDVIPNIDQTRDALFGVQNPLDTFTKGNDAAAEAVGKVGPRAKMSKEEVEAYTKTTKKSSEDIVAAKKAEEKAWDTYVSNLRAWLRILSDEVVSYRKVVETMAPAVKASMSTEHIETFNKAQVAVKEAADKAVAAMKGHELVKPVVEDVTVAVKDLSDKLVIGARTALDVGDAFGIIDDQAKTALTSTLNVADAISKMMTGGVTFAGVAAVVGGVGSIVSNMMAGDRERRQLMAQNNVRLSELRDEIGNLDLNVTGDDFISATEVLKKIIPLSGSPQDLAKNAGAIQGILAKAGMTMGDLVRIAEEMGINIKGANGAVDFKLLPQLLEALGLAEFGTFGQDFASQLRSVRAGFGVNNTNEIGQISGLANLGGTFSSALRGIFDANDIGGSRTRLQALFARLQSGGVSASEMGGLTGSQFLELITDLIDRIDNLGTGSGGGVGGGVGEIGGPGTGGGDSGVPAMTTTLGDVLGALSKQFDSTEIYHGASLGFMERTANATEETAQNTAAALSYLDAMLKATTGGASGTVDEDLGRRVSIDRRLNGVSVV